MSDWNSFGNRYRLLYLRILLKTKIFLSESSSSFSHAGLTVLRRTTVIRLVYCFHRVQLSFYVPVRVLCTSARYIKKKKKKTTSDFRFSSINKTRETRKSAGKHEFNFRTVFERPLIEIFQNKNIRVPKYTNPYGTGTLRKSHV